MIEYDKDLSLHGLIEGINNELYHAGPGVSASDIKFLWETTPAHWVDRKESPPKPPSASQALGTAFHAAVLEPDVLETAYFTAEPVPPVPDSVAHWRETRTLARSKLNLRTKADKATYADFLERHAGEVQEEEAYEVWCSAIESRNLERRATLIELKPEDRERVLRMRDSALANSRVRALLAPPAQMERSLYWRDPKTGLLCKCRPDILADHLGIIGDLKSSAAVVTREEFTRAIDKWLYHIQAAHYLAGAHILGLPVYTFVFIAVESESPFGCKPYELEPEDIALGREMRDFALGQLARAIEQGNWKPYTDEVETIHLPQYAYKKVADRLAGRWGRR